MDFIYNDNYEKRGVWHITDALKVKSKPAETERKVYGDEDTEYVFEHAAHEHARGKSICGQADCMTGGETDSYTDWDKAPVDGVKVIRYKAKRAYYQRGLDNPPAPLCSRCAKKAGLD